MLTYTHYTVQMSSCCVWFLPLLVIVRSNCNVLTFEFITSFGEFGLNTSGVVPAVDMAISDINNRSILLPGYTLAYDSVRDSQVSLNTQRYSEFGVEGCR